VVVVVLLVLLVVVVVMVAAAVVREAHWDNARLGDASGAQRFTSSWRTYLSKTLRGASARDTRVRLRVCRVHVCVCVSFECFVSCEWD
jgi:hypothetical protein